MTQRFLNILEKNKQGLGAGIYSVCSANRFVLQASMLQAKKDNSLLLIEATSNQVDQFGGYTGMTPHKFSAFAQTIALEMDFPWENVVLGGDHLGPNVWQHLPEKMAMANAQAQIEAYVKAGFTKIHLDTSMPLGGDELPLDPGISAARAAELCAVAELAYTQNTRRDTKLVYVIGTEVPIPGGAQEKLDTVRPTAVSDVHKTLELTRKAFEQKGLPEAWNRVIAVVVQPGVEFSDDNIVEYSAEKAGALSAFIKKTPKIVYEAHSTDYQTEVALSRMVQDHFAILKVGPWLTYALREAVFALAKMENEWLGHRKDVDLSHIIDVIERQMLEKPQYWQKHYQGSKPRQAFARRYSYSDRVRYYWTNEAVKASLQILIKNLERFPLPDSLISQYLPEQYTAIRIGELSVAPRDLIHHKIIQVLEIYAQATRMGREAEQRLAG